MAWAPASSHGFDKSDPLTDVLAMAVSGETVYAAAYRTGQDRDAELWKARVGDERWALAGRLLGIRRPDAMALHAGVLYVGGGGSDGFARLVRVSLGDVMTELAVPVAGGPILSLLSIGPYLYLTMQRIPGTIDATIWQTALPDDASAWAQIASEIGAGRPHVHAIYLGAGRTDDILAGTARQNPGGRGSSGEGAEVWRGSDFGARWERLAVDGFGDPNTGGVPALRWYRDLEDNLQIYASAQNHTAGSTLYKLSRHWEPLPYASTAPFSPVRGAPIRSMALFEKRLFIAEGNNLTTGVRLYWTITGSGWTEDRPFLGPAYFVGSGGEMPIALHALTPVDRRWFLYVAVQYEGAGVKIWRRTFTGWDALVNGFYEYWAAVRRLFRRLFS